MDFRLRRFISIESLDASGGEVIGREFEYFFNELKRMDIKNLDWKSLQINFKQDWEFENQHELSIGIDVQRDSEEEE